jgi:Predicted nucleotide kinase
MYNLFLTGYKGIGKSTLLKKVIGHLDCTIGGFIVRPIFVQGGLAFDMVSLYDGAGGNIFAVLDGYGKITDVYTKVFDKSGVEILDKSFAFKDLIVMDELGFLESDAGLFKKCVFDILDSKKPVLGVLKKYDSQFLNTIRERQDTKIIEVTAYNRDSLCDEIISLLGRWGVPLKTGF